MAFGITRAELEAWKKKVEAGEIAFLTHFWLHPKFPGVKTVTKVGCADIEKLINWGISEGLSPDWVDWHHRYPHFDLIAERQRKILLKYKLYDHLYRFNIF